MKISIKHHVFIAALSTLVLASCGGGSSSGTTAPSGTLTTIKVENPQNLNLVSAVVKTKDDQIIFNSDLSCDTNSCSIFLPIEVNQPVAIRYLNSQKNLVGAFMFPSGLPAYKSIQLTKLSLGLYLVNRLSVDFMSKDNISWQNLDSRLKTLFTNYSSPDGTPDPYEEVGIYYDLKVKASGMTEDQFLADLRARLLKWDVALASEFSLASQSPFNSLMAWFEGLHIGKRPFIGVAYAQAAGGCSSDVSTFLGLTQNIGGMFPYVGGVISGVTQIFQDACSTTGSSLQSILAKLDTLQTSVDMLGQNIGALTSFLTSDAANEQTTQFENLRIRANTVASQYQLFLKNNGATSLVQYFQAKGGWDNGLAAGGITLKDILYTPYKTSADTQMLQVIASVTGNSNFKTYLAALKSKCFALPNSSAENFVVVRSSCNAIIASNTAFLMGTQSSMMPIFQDIYAVLDLYKDVVQSNQAKVSNDFPLPLGVSSYANAVADIKAIFAKQQTKMVADYNSITGGVGFYNIYDGLNKDLMARMVTRDCMQAGTTENAYPAITGWYAPNTNKDDNYIVTDCKNSYSNYQVNANSRAKARYYYNNQGDSDANDPANVLGVLVPSGIVRGEWREYRVNNASVKTSAIDNSGTQFDVQAPFIVAYNNEQPRSSYVVKYGNGNGGNASFRVDALRGLKDWYSVTNPNYGGAVNFTWVSYQDKNQFTYVTHLMVEYFQGVKNQVTMACASYDCSVNTTYQTLQYKNGPEVRLNAELGAYLKE